MQNDAQYKPPWRDCAFIGVAGSSGSGKTSMSLAIVETLNLPWVVIMSMDSFYRPLSPEDSKKAFRNEYDFDSPSAIDFDLLVERLKDLKAGKKAEIPKYSFEKHARLPECTTIYSPHVLVLEGIFALHDERVREMLDLKIFAEADADLCLSRRLVRDVRERGRDIEGCIKQWFGFVKPNFHRFVLQQREIADIIVPRGIENKIAIDMVSDNIRKTLSQKSLEHQAGLKRLRKSFRDTPISSNVIVLKETSQVAGINTVMQDPRTSRENFIFNFNRMSVMLIERATETVPYLSKIVQTPTKQYYKGLKQEGIISAIVVLRGGSIMEPALHKVIPDCVTGRILIQTNIDSSEPELHFRHLPKDIETHSKVLMLDSQMASGGAALMAVQVLVDYGVDEDKIVFVCYFAGTNGLSRLMAVFPKITVIVCRIGEDEERRWVEAKYLGS